MESGMQSQTGAEKRGKPPPPLSLRFFRFFVVLKYDETAKKR